jgi:hypothetical protein
VILFFVVKIQHFAKRKKNPSNMVKGTFGKLPEK